MFSRIFNLSTLLFIFIYFNCSIALKCYHCENNVECANASLIECNKFVANVAVELLKGLYENVTSIPIKSPTSFECITERLSFKRDANITYKTCAYTDLDTCKLKLLPHFNNNYNRSCFNCNWDKCNSSTRLHYGGYIALIVPAFLIVVLNYFK